MTDAGSPPSGRRPLCAASAAAALVMIGVLTLTVSATVDVSPAAASPAVQPARLGPTLPQAPVLPSPGRAMGTTMAGNIGLAGQCTWGALQKWYEASGNRFYPAVSGDAKDWDAAARTAGWTVVNDAQPRSIVVFQPNVQYAHPVYGHVAWVNSVSERNDGVYINITEMNNSAHGGEFQWWTRDVKNVAGMSYILLP